MAVTLTPEERNKKNIPTSASVVDSMVKKPQQQPTDPTAQPVATPTATPQNTQPQGIPANAEIPTSQSVVDSMIPKREKLPDMRKPTDNPTIQNFATDLRMDAEGYQKQAEQYAPEDKEDAKARRNKEKWMLIGAGIADGIGALSNFYAAHRGGVPGTYDASKGASVAVGTALEKAQQHREQNRQLYDNYMDKARAARMSAAQLLQQWEYKKTGNDLKELRIQLAQSKELREQAKFLSEQDKQKWNTELTQARIRLADANASKAEIEAEIGRINVKWRDRINAANVAAKNASANKNNMEAQNTTTVTTGPLIIDGEVVGTQIKTSTKTHGNGVDRTAPAIAKGNDKDDNTAPFLRN